MIKTIRIRHELTGEKWSKNNYKKAYNWTLEMAGIQLTDERKVKYTLSKDSWKKRKGKSQLTLEDRIKKENYG